MKITKSILVFICVWCFCVVGYGINASDETQTDEKIQAILDHARIEYDLPALSVSINSPKFGGTKNFVSGYHSLSDKKKISPETLFEMGSITKTFTATIVYKLVEEHKISLDDKLEKWLPEYPIWKDITVKDLLHHTSGTYNYTSGKSFDRLLQENPRKYWSMYQLVDIAYKKPSLFKAGEKYHYSNTDYILLGLIIEKITHDPIEKVFENYFYTYGLNNTFYNWFKHSAPIYDKIAHGYNRDGTLKLNADATAMGMLFGQSAGAIISTPGDIVKWLMLLFDGKIIQNTSLAHMKSIISEKTAKPVDMANLSAPINFPNHSLFVEIGAGAGIGLIYMKHGGFVWVHAGGTPGYESFYAYSPSRKIYLALAYSIKPKQQFIFIHIADKIFQALEDQPVAEHVKAS